MSTQVPVDAPWQAANALEYDGQTLETWIRDNSATQRYRNLVPLATRPIFGTEPRDLSLLFVLFYIAASGDETHAGTFERNFNTRTARRCSGSRAARRGRGTHGPGARQPDLLLRHPVHRIMQSASGVDASRPTTVTVAGQAGRRRGAADARGPDRVRPLLPFQRDQLTQRMARAR